jgi:hypothetical protein
MEGLLQLVLDSVPSHLSKIAYRRALLEFFSADSPPKLPTMVSVRPFTALTETR